MNTVTPIETIPFDFMPHDEDLLDLPQSALEQASKLSRTCKTPESSWQAYLGLLALAGFSEWITDNLENCGLQLSFQTDRSRLLPNALDQPAAITQVTLNEFKLCILATSSNRDDIIQLPAAVVDRPAYIPHFYITVMVNPESEVASVQSFLRYDQLQQYRQERNLVPIDGYYEIESDRFEPKLEKLLFLVTGLEPSAIPLPERIPTFSLDRIRELIIHPTINAATWVTQQITEQVTEQIDQLSESFNTLLGHSDDLALAFVPTDRRLNQTNFRSTQDNSFRFPETSLSDMLQNIQQQGYIIPIDIHASYQDIVLDDQPLRITIVTWPLPEPSVTSNDEGKCEWSLLLIGELLGDSIEEIQMTIQQQESVISSIELERSGNHYMIQAFGSFDEVFTISLANRATERCLPPIGFQID